MTDAPKIAELDAGTPVSSVFLLQNMVLATAKSGKSYMTLTLGDKDGSYEGKLWDQAELVYDQLEKMTPVEVDGVISVYRERNQVTVRTIRALPWSDDLFEKLVPTSRFSLARLTADLDRVLDTVADPAIARLIQVLREDASLMETFSQVPAAKWIHHAYLRGLLEHTTSMLTIAAYLADHYEGQFPGLIDRDVLLAGTLLHDMGKTVEYEYRHGIDLTTRGRLVGHLVLGMEILNEAVRKVPELSQERADRIRHLIASHHGDFEKGAPIRPVTMEAQLLHLVDYLDSQINAVGTVLDGVAPGEWSDYSRKFERSFLRPAGPVVEPVDDEPSEDDFPFPDLDEPEMVAEVQEDELEETRAFEPGTAPDELEPAPAMEAAPEPAPEVEPEPEQPVTDFDETVEMVQEDAPEPKKSTEPPGEEPQAEDSKPPKPRTRTLF